MQNLIQKNKIVIEQIYAAIRSYRKQDYFNGNLQVKRMYKNFEEVFDILLGNKDVLNEYEEIVNEEEWISIITETKGAQESEDYVLLADLLEINWLMRLLKIQMSLIMRLTDGSGVVADCSDGDKKYIVEYTSTGSYTVKIEKGNTNFYLNSNNNPYEEAMLFADQYINTEADTYLVFGLGLGYHIRALAEKSPETNIIVYESDINVLRLADNFGELDMKRKIFKNVSIVSDPDFSQIRQALNNITESTEFLIHMPSLKNVENQLIKEKLEEYFVNLSSIKNQKKYLDANFKKNVLLGDENVDALLFEFQGKTVVLAARGPSLNEDIEGLKRVRDDVILVAVYSVAQLLLDNGIIPDYMVVSDAQTQLSNEIKNEELHKIPLIYVSTAAHNVVESHLGKRYILLQEGYVSSEDIAEQNGNMLFSTGGSVATVILDICIRFKCAKVICLGLDLAYTNGRSHAEGTRGIEEVEGTELRTVMDVNGNPISTRKNLDIYRKWIERRIEGITDIEFINASGGAFIKGMKHQRIGRLGNILVYYGQSSYKSMITFAQQLITAWELMGYNVAAINAREKDAGERLMSACRNKYDFIFSMNGILADTQFDDGSYVQNYLHTPFIAMMVDHPIYFADRLESKLTDYRVLLTDRNHVDYVKQYYPNVTEAYMLPHGGMGVSPEQITPYGYRKLDVLFSGSYTEPDDILQSVSSLPGKGQVIVMNIIEQMIKDTDVTAELALKEFLRENEISASNTEFKQYMELAMFSDRYIRALYRKLVLMALVSNGIKVHVFGNGWNRFKSSNPGNIIIGGSIDPAKCMELMANAKIVLNVMPWFKRGSHERVFNAMMNGAISLTDKSEYLEKEFTDGEDIVFYDIKNLSGMVNKVKYLLAHDDEAEQIALRGYEKASEKHTWKIRAEQIIHLANEINGKEGEK